MEYSRRLSMIWATVAVLILYAGAAARADEIEALPATVHLQGKDARQQLLLSVKLSGGAHRDVTRTATYRSADPGVAAVSTAGVVQPVASGKTQIEAIVGQTKLAIPVTITQGGAFLPLNFRTDISPMLTKAGCNGGGCHGKTDGRGSFQLSLFGFNPASDFEAMVNGSRGRRVFASSPENSLLLLKAAGLIPHGGGKRLPIGEPEHQRLCRWIATGTPWETAKTPELERLEVFPAMRRFIQDAEQQIVVMAAFSDGTRRDVTRLTVFTSNDPGVAVVDDAGVVTMQKRTGETAIVCKYDGQIGVARVLVPLDKSDVASRWPKLPKANFIDDHVMTKLHELNVPPSGLATDSAFLRRATLQIAGRLPSIDEAKTFLADSDSDKRIKLVDRLLHSGDYADVFAQKWSDVLRNKLRQQKSRHPGTVAFHRWVRNAVADNMPYDRFVREIITATGRATSNPPAQWYAEVRYLDRYVDDTAQVFLGVRIGCARCHNHPFEKYTQNDYFGLAAFFARVGRKGGNGIAERAADEIIYVNPTGSVKHPVTGLVVQPHGLGGNALDIAPYDDPRDALADWMARPDNPYFARAFVNRMWAHFFGRGLVDPLDDMRASNPAANEPLLNALAQEFIKSNFDMRHLVRRIVTSTTYQLSSEAHADNLDETTAYSRFYPQRMTAEVLYDAISTVTRTPPAAFSGMPAGTRAVQLPHEGFADQLLDLFGRPPRESACECERLAEPSLAQSLYLMNNPAFLGKVQSNNAFAGQLAKDKRSADDKVRDLFLATLARQPTPKEMTVALDHLRVEGSTVSAYADLIWVLMNTKEFLYVL
jgi:hypothetical protein